MKHVHEQLYIGGRWEQPRGAGTIDVVEASTEEVIGQVPEASTADLDTAVARARAAMQDPDGWGGWSVEERAALLDRFAAVMAERGEEFAQLVSRQNGMPIGTARAAETGYPAGLLQMYAAMIRGQEVEDERAGAFGGTVHVRRKPVGVVGAIVPWNYPQTLLFFKLAPALAAGCTVVVKPSPETVLDTFLLAQVLESLGMPAGVVSILPGGRDLGRALVEHPGIDKIAFTGSTAAGRQIAETCGRLLRPVTLELGGKSAAIVLDDADLSSNIESLFAATMMNNGQTCFLGTRVLAPQARYDEVVDTLTDMASSAVIGDPLDEATMIGPMASATHRERVENYIGIGKKEGARMTTGGGRPAARPHGWFVEPTIFADVDNHATISREEIFGPVLSVIAYGDVDQAVRIANDSDYGLGGTVWTQDLERGLEVARRVETGSIGVNTYLPDPVAPFGGVKDSGIGRELGAEGLANYQVQTSIYLPGKEV
ncbi:aldehyde dehydrogenase [Nitriliruptor alkaliphilus]|uniref:aldehyde dehydrogenase n=1 Tax=Nitriliruptor alkaliphilus TaxID=427918 RepID=UPI000B0AAB7D|nr:aldehyde dehydrogenase [Nitriliruptor alkaliphilus]